MQFFKSVRTSAKANRLGNVTLPMEERSCRAQAARSGGMNGRKMLLAVMSLQIGLQAKELCA